MVIKKILSYVVILVALIGCYTSYAEAAFAPENKISLSEPQSTVSLACSSVTAEPLKTVELQQTFIDNFSGETLSPTLWQTYYYDDAKKFSGRTLSGNSEKEIYVDPNFSGKGFEPLGLNPFRLEKGIMSIIAKRTPPELKFKLYDMPFTSGVISSQASFKQTYGYFEIYARLPRGKALWPAFWLVEAGQWPPEIDVFEVMDSTHPDHVVMTTHWKNNGTGNHKMSACGVNVSTADSEFHAYGVLWTPVRIVYYVDRKPVVQIATPPGLNQPMHLLANLAIEKNADASTPSSASYDIDWITAYQLPEGN